MNPPHTERYGLQNSACLRNDSLHQMPHSVPDGGKLGQVDGGGVGVLFDPALGDHFLEVVRGITAWSGL